MKKNLIKPIIAGLTLLYAAHGALYAAEQPKISGSFILKNNSAFNIKYKFDKPDQTVRPDEEVLLPAGGSTMLDATTLSIRRSGAGSSYVSSWKQVPSVANLMQQLSVNAFHKLDLALSMRGCIPIINIQSGYTGAWTFTVSATCPQ